MPGMSRDGQVGRGQRGGFQRGKASASRGPCGYCGKPNHTENNCWKKEGKCLRCGGADHQLATCPVLSRDGRGNQQLTRTNSEPAKVEGTKPKIAARVYSMEPQQVPDSSEVVEGTIPVFHRFAKVLVDLGATHSFVNPNFMCGIDIKPASLPYDLEVSTPMGDHRLITSMVYKDCKIWVGKRKLLGDLINLSIKRYDVILDMDWLARYNAQLDCKRKVVEFRILGEATLRLWTEQIERVEVSHLRGVSESLTMRTDRGDRFDAGVPIVGPGVVLVVRTTPISTMWLWRYLMKGEGLGVPMIRITLRW
ncbi:uncharacterized protein [Coffea arabica]|uniref:CCHC-type domain-containing protein n=1 Tax=Coffea arabica TaxID=13443 RepID=A0ABM4VC44_COFAR